MKHVVVIEGEDAAPEAVRPVVALIDSLGLDIEWQYPAVGDAASPISIYRGRRRATGLA